MNAKLSQKAYELVRMTDCVAIKPNQTFEDIKKLVAYAKEYDFFLVYGLQCYNEYMLRELKGSNTLVGGAIGCASSAGEECLEEKIASAKHWMDVGCQELDMFINVPALRSKQYDLVEKEMKAIRDIAVNTPLKALIQSPMLSDEEIKIVSEMAVAAKFDFVKTASGFYGGTTIEQVKIIKEAVGNKAQIKAAGGVDGLAMIEELKALGVTRFGLSYGKVLKLIDELADK